MTKVNIFPWTISRESETDAFSQSVFCLGNGYLGVRGFGGWETKTNPQEHGIFRAGLFDFIRPGITDMVQLPDVLTLCPAGELPGTVRQSLDMRHGVLSQSWEREDAAFVWERAVSMADSQLILTRLTLTAKRAGTFTVTSAADADVCNLPVHDDQTVTAKELVRLLALEQLDGGSLHMRTVPGGHAVRLSWSLSSSRPAASVFTAEGSRAQTSLTLSLAAGETWTVEKHVRVCIKGEAPNPVVQDHWGKHRNAMVSLWEDCDIELDAEESLQGAVRYNIFQLLCSNAAQDCTVSIGARGLTHGRYKGNTFWDTDIFLLPFYLYTRPQAARNLLLYRADRLDDARELARRQNLQGARYPWMCADTGREQCESWDIGLCEIHITGDVAYAMQRYVEVTGDESFLREHAAPVWRETARYWLSRLTWEKGRNQYSSFFVKGPDEYCGAAVNNTYTNYLARNNIRLALAYGGLCGEEREKAEHANAHIALLYDEQRGLYLQDELLERLEEAPFLKRSDEPSYKEICYDRMQRYRVLKQADLVLLMTLFPRDFTTEQKRAVFEYYEPITLHDSTLSFGVHAQLALELGLWDKAEMYLQKGVFLDLYDVMGNTGREGIHMAALGAAWQALAFGAAGITVDENGAVTARPRLPKSIRALRMKVYARGKQYQVSVRASGGTEVRLILQEGGGSVVS